MAHIGLISCASKKRATSARSMDLYDSALFAKARAFVEQYCDYWFILSAKHGLLVPDHIINPYEETLKTKSALERQEWSQHVWQALCSYLSSGDKVTILAGERYREYLVPRLATHGCLVCVPLQGMGIGRQLQWLTQQVSKPNRKRDIERFYACLHKLEHGLGGKRLMRDCTAQQGWPARGVYLFFEPNEVRSTSMEHRVVRVGTHGVSRGSKATLWNRLRTHRGTREGLGNHRSSVFRLHVGAALLSRDDITSMTSWGFGQNATSDIRMAEETLERRVSDYIGSMSLLWLAIDDEPGPSSDRAYIERNLIGMLVGREGTLDPPTSHWLGSFSPDHRIRKSGLWNLDFLDHIYSPECLGVIEEYVSITLKEKNSAGCSIAPSDWYSNERQRIFHKQLPLFEE